MCQPSARAVRDRELCGVIQNVCEANYSCYGVRKIWKATNREYADRFAPVARSNRPENLDCPKPTTVDPPH